MTWSYQRVGKLAVWDLEVPGSDSSFQTSSRAESMDSGRHSGIHQEGALGALRQEYDGDVGQRLVNDLKEY